MHPKRLGFDCVACTGGIQNRFGSLFFILIYMSVMSLSSLPLWMEDRLLFIRSFLSSVCQDTATGFTPAVLYMPDCLLFTKHRIAAADPAAHGKHLCLLTAVLHWQTDSDLACHATVSHVFSTHVEFACLAGTGSASCMLDLAHSCLWDLHATPG